MTTTTHNLYSPFTPTPTHYPSPLHKPKMIGITGKRNVGKSTVATLLEEKYGFTRVHAFDGGKVATLAYFEYITKNKEIAYRMVYGDLKDVPSPYLPNNVAPRYFLEKFGQFMGVDMGIDWTLAMEIGIVRDYDPPQELLWKALSMRPLGSKTKVDMCCGWKDQTSLAPLAWRVMRCRPRLLRTQQLVRLACMS